MTAAARTKGPSRDYRAKQALYGATGAVYRDEQIDRFEMEADTRMSALSTGNRRKIPFGSAVSGRRRGRDGARCSVAAAVRFVRRDVRTSCQPGIYERNPKE